MGRCPDMGIKNDGAHKRVRQLFYMDERTQEFGPYDFGKVRSLNDYEKYAGVSFKKRTVQQYTLYHQVTAKSSFI